MGYEVYDKKIIKSGNIVEIWEYEKPVSTGYKSSSNDITALEKEFLRQQNRVNRFYRKFQRLIKEKYTGERMEEKLLRLDRIRKDALELIAIRMEKAEEKAKESNRKRSLKRTLENATRLINANESRLRRFLTLTFEQDVVDITLANLEFSKFMKRVRKHLQRKELEKTNAKLKKKKKLSEIPLPALDYVAVIEFQTLTRDFVVHYHCLWDAPYIKQEKLQELWGQGHIWINALDKEHATKNTGNYLMKYMKKSFQKIAAEKGEEFDFEEQLKAKRSMDKLFGRQRVLRSEGLYEPIEIKNKKGVQEVMAGLQEHQFEISNTYDSEFNGKISYKRYNLKKTK